MKRNFIVFSLMLVTISACTLNNRKFVQSDTQLHGEAAENLEHLYGTYRVLDQMSKSLVPMTTVKLVKENGKPVFRMYDKKSGSENLVISPDECHAEPGKNGYLVICGEPSMFSYEPFIMFDNLPIEYKEGNALFGYHILTIKPGEYSMYLSWNGGPNGKFELQKIDDPTTVKEQPVSR